MSFIGDRIASLFKGRVSDRTIKKDAAGRYQDIQERQHKISEDSAKLHKDLSQQYVTLVQRVDSNEFNFSLVRESAESKLEPITREIQIILSSLSEECVTAEDSNKLKMASLASEKIKSNQILRDNFVEALENGAQDIFRQSIDHSSNRSSYSPS